MLDKIKPASPNGQRSRCLDFPTYDEIVAHDKLVAQCQYKFLRLLDVEEIGCADGIGWCSGPLTWPTVRDFDRGGLSLFYRTPDGDWRNVCIDDFTGIDGPRPIRVLRALGDVNATVARGKRSHVIFSIGMTLAEAGANAAELTRILRKSKCWQSKWGNNERALKAEVSRILAKARMTAWTLMKRGDDI
jgi:hypothetical protein